MTKVVVSTAPSWKRGPWAIGGIAAFICCIYVHQAINAFGGGSGSTDTARGVSSLIAASRRQTQGIDLCNSNGTFRNAQDVSSDNWIVQYLEMGVTAPFTLFFSGSGKIAASIVGEIARHKKLVERDVEIRPYSHMISPTIMQLVHHPLLLARVQALLGDDVLLFETDVATRRPEPASSYPTDPSLMDCPADDAVIVWLALRSTPCVSSLEVLPYSHKLEAIAPNYFPSQHLGAKTEQEARDYATMLNNASELLTERFGAPGEPPITSIRMDLADGEAIMFHPKLWQSTFPIAESESDKRARVAINLRFMKPTCQPRAKSYAAPYGLLAWLPPVLMVHGNVSNETYPFANAYKWGGSTTVPAGKTPFDLLEHRYTSEVSTLPPKTIDIPWLRKIAKPLELDSAYIFHTPAISYNSTETTLYKTPKSKMKTARIGSLEMKWVYQPANTPSEVWRHASEDFTVLMTGKLRLTQLLHNGTYARETVVNKPGSLSVANSMAWHKTTAVSPEGAMYLEINYMANQDLDGPITTYANTDLANIYNASAAESTRAGIVRHYNGKNLDVLSTGRSLHVTKHIVKQGQRNYRMEIASMGHDALVVMLAGSVKVEGKLAVPKNRQISQFAMMFLPSNATVALVSHKGLAAEYELFEFKGPAFGDK